MKKVKNNTGSAESWVGMTIQPGEYYVIQSSEMTDWQVDSEVISDLISGDLLINDGADDFPPGATAVDFLKDEYGPFSPSGGYRARFDAVAGTATAGTTTDFDLTLTADRYLNGVSLVADTPVAGDYVTFQIVHPTYGVVNEFGTKWYMAPGVVQQSPVVLNFTVALASGLKIRTKYTSVGGTNVFVGVNLWMYSKDE